MHTELSFPWNTLQRLQALTDSLVINARTNGCEEALTVIVDDLATGKVPRDAVAMELRYKTLSANRKAKYHYRKHLYSKMPDNYLTAPRRNKIATILCSRLVDHSDQLVVRELAAMAESQVSPTGWALLCEIGDGVPYVEVGSKLGKKIGTLKSQVSRLRRDFRDSDVGSIIRDGLLEH